MGLCSQIPCWVDLKWTCRIIHDPPKMAIAPTRLGTRTAWVCLELCFSFFKDYLKIPSVSLRWNSRIQARPAAGLLTLLLSTILWSLGSPSAGKWLVHWEFSCSTSTTTKEPSSRETNRTIQGRCVWLGGRGIEGCRGLTICGWSLFRTLAILGSGPQKAFWGLRRAFKCCIWFSSKN